MAEFLHLERGLGRELHARLANDLGEKPLYPDSENKAFLRGLDMELRATWKDFSIDARIHVLADAKKDALDNKRALRMPISMVRGPLRHRLLDLVVELAETRALISVFRDAHAEMRQQALSANPPAVYRLLVTPAALAVWEPNRVDVAALRAGRARAIQASQTDPHWGVIVTPQAESAHDRRAGQRAAAQAVATIAGMY